MVTPYVYKLTDLVTGEFYIGVRYANKSFPEDDLGIRYFTSSALIKQRGFDRFKKEILCLFFKKEAAIEYESELISEAWGNPLLLNRHNKGVKFKNDKPRPAWLKERLSMLNKGKKNGPMSDEHKRKISLANKGKTISNGRKPLSTATKERMKEAHKGMSFKRINLTCPVCNKTMDIGNYNKHGHGINCRSIQ